MASYNEEFKKRIVRMHLEEGRTIKSLSEEYHVSENGIGYWLKKYREECSKNPAAKEEYDLMKENLKLRKELEEMRYNCTILDLYDRSVIASVHDRNITAELGKKALEAAMSQHPWVLKNGVILHSDQGSQYTSKEFADYCSAHNITQSMSRAGCPYDNAPMERYFNTLKSELIYQHSYSSEKKLFADIDDYVLLWYNSVRPNSFNNGLTPWQKRIA